jgi:protoheme IX farnesyltransferase
MPRSPTRNAEAGGTTVLARARVAIGVFKLRIATLIMVTALAGLASAGGGSASATQVVVIALAVLLASAAAGAFNQFAEAASDRLMARTRWRPFACGALPRSRGWLAGIAALLALAIAAAAWFVNVPAALFTLAGALTYALVYTLALKRRTPWNIVVGGLAGSFAVLAGAAAAGSWSEPQALLLAWVLFLWTPPHFWSLAIANEAEYRAAGVPMLPVVVGPERAARIVHASAIALVASSLLLPLFGTGWVVFAGALAGGGWFLAKTRALARTPTRQAAFAAFFASMAQLSALLAAVALDAALR